MVLCKGWPLQQIVGTLKRQYPDEAPRRVFHETIYNALYVMPLGELRKVLAARV
jgi:IS30 family transposase